MCTRLYCVKSALSSPTGTIKRKYIYKKTMNFKITFNQQSYKIIFLILTNGLFKTFVRKVTLQTFKLAPFC